jgi:peptide/nickel transport system permease protein
MMLGLCGVVLAAAIVWPSDPLAQSSLRLAGPSWQHPLGTDQFGRDLLARILSGARLSVGGAACVCIGTAAVGLMVAAIAALGPRWIDALLSRLVEALLAIPTLVLALGLAAVLGRTLPSLLLALVAAGWPAQARIFRTLMRQELAMPYADAARTLGVHPLMIAWRHLLPNIAGPVIVIATAGLGANILSLAALSFLGLGVQPPTAEWGLMINEARLFFQLHPWQMMVPGLAIVLTVAAANLAGDRLRDRLDPTGRIVSA